MIVNKKFFKNRTVQTIIIVGGIFLIFNLFRDILRLIRASEQIKLAEKKVEELEKETEELRHKREYYKSKDFIEEQARNKLNMAKPGEIIVILPPNIEEVLGQGKEFSPPQLPNWKKWWQLFF